MLPHGTISLWGGYQQPRMLSSKDDKYEKWTTIRDARAGTELEK